MMEMRNHKDKGSDSGPETEEAAEEVVMDEPKEVHIREPTKTREAIVAKQPETEMPMDSVPIENHLY